MTILLRQFAFLATVAFVAITLIAAPGFAAEPGSDEELEQVMALMTQRLSLSPYQVEKIGPRVREHLDAMRGRRANPAISRRLLIGTPACSANSP